MLVDCVFYWFVVELIVLRYKRCIGCRLYYIILICLDWLIVCLAVYDFYVGVGCSYVRCLF